MSQLPRFTILTVLLAHWAAVPEHPNFIPCLVDVHDNHQKEQ